MPVIKGLYCAQVSTVLVATEPLCTLAPYVFIMNFRELHCILHPTMEKLRQSTFCLKEKQTQHLWISMAETVFTWQSGPTTSNTSSTCNASSS